MSDSTLTVKELDDLMSNYSSAIKVGTFKETGWGGNPYIVSNVGVSALSRIQQRVLSKDHRHDIAVNYVHPGYVAMDMTWDMWDIWSDGLKTPEEGAHSAIYAALLPLETDVKGKYIWSNGQLVDWVSGPKPSE